MPPASMTPRLLIDCLYSASVPKPGMETSGKVTADPVLPWSTPVGPFRMVGRHIQDCVWLPSPLPGVKAQPATWPRSLSPVGPVFAVPAGSPGEDSIVNRVPAEKPSLATFGDHNTAWVPPDR